MQSKTELSSEPSQQTEDLGKALALKKLTLEIAELERPWWKRPSYILAALPTLLAITALSVGFLNGFFSAQLTKLENQRHDVESQIRDFEEKRDELHKQNEKTKVELDQTKLQLSKAQEQVNDAHEDIDFLARTVGLDKETLRFALQMMEGERERRKSHKPPS